MIIKKFYHGLGDPTQGILDAEGIFLYKTPNEAFRILKDKVLLKLDFLKECHISLKPKTIVSVGGRNIDVGHEILMEKALTKKIDSEFLIIRKELKEIVTTLEIDIMGKIVSSCISYEQLHQMRKTTRFQDKYEYVGRYIGMQKE
nr:reverse transcriptase domain-containing protein [Tanacetum cinerariifolium]